MEKMGRGIPPRRREQVVKALILRDQRTQDFDKMQQYWIQKMKKEDIGTIVEQCSSKHEKKESKTKSKSRMKQLLRWAAPSISEKGGKFIIGKISRTRNRGTLKADRDDDRATGDSPKISFRWETESCSSISSAYSSASTAYSFKNCSITLNSTAIKEINHYYPRKGSWITTDSECKALIPISQTDENYYEAKQ